MQGRTPTARATVRARRDVAERAWQFTTLFGKRPAILSESDGRWNIVLDTGCCVSGDSMDEAVARAVRADAEGDAPRRRRPARG